MNFDVKLFFAINSWGPSVFLQRLILLADKYGVYFFAAVLVAYFFANRKIFWRSLVAGILARGVFTELIRWAYHRPRPFVVLEHVRQLIEKNTNEASFPSGHAAFYFAVAFAVYLGNKSTGRVMLILAGVLSIARVYLGVHYPSDILGGAVVGLVSALAAEKLVAKYHQLP